jgi:hypothetical protein
VRSRIWKHHTSRGIGGGAGLSGFRGLSGFPGPGAEQTNEQSPLSLAEIAHLLNAYALAAPQALAVASHVEASVFAGKVEDLARSVEYLQLLAAGIVDRTRTEAITAAAAARSSRSRSWVTGWDNGVETLNETDANWPAPATPCDGDTSSAHDGVTTADAGTGTESADPALTSPADDGCRNTAEFLRLRLRIPLREARRRLSLAGQALPGTSLTGEPLLPARPHLAAALAPTTGPCPAARDADTGTATGADAGTDTRRAAAPTVPSHAGTIITAALDRLQHRTTPEVLDRIEQDLTTTAATADPDFLARLAQRWTETIDADGLEPNEEALRHTQGAFIRKPRHGLHHLEIFATTEQYENLLTAMNAATNPRTRNEPTSANAAEGTLMPGDDSNTCKDEVCSDAHCGTGPSLGLDPDLERRSRSQKQLDGLISAVKAGLTTNGLPTSGGNRPQIIATINYQDLFPHPAKPSGQDSTGVITGTVTNTESAAETGNTNTPSAAGTGNFVFTGPVAAATLRKIACDADIIPALLGTHGEILDLGRKTRLFTPAQRLALTARDQGCTFPNCTIPAPWCEAHHITYWSRGGPTTIDNGALLCSAHHHLVHKEQWTITTRNGTPWYIPPQHIDPGQKPQQNQYFRPPPPPGTPRE